MARSERPIDMKFFMFAGRQVSGLELRAIRALSDGDMTAREIGKALRCPWPRGWRALRIMSSLEERGIVRRYFVAPNVFWALTAVGRTPFGGPE